MSERKNDDWREDRVSKLRAREIEERGAEMLYCRSRVRGVRSVENE